MNNNTKRKDIIHLLILSILLSFLSTTIISLQSINTLIKHSAGLFSFKIGVRELGWRTKHTLNHEEVLNDPADYTLLDIWQRLEKDNRFYEFAREVCQRRFDRLSRPIKDFRIEDAFENLSMEQEAERLGVRETDLIKKFGKLELEPAEEKLYE